VISISHDPFASAGAPRVKVASRSSTVSIVNGVEQSPPLTPKIPEGGASMPIQRTTKVSSTRTVSPAADDVISTPSG
jgi:hypothetical protein